jgi:hypothetical protein
MPSLRLAVGPLRFEVACEDPGLAAALGRRYGPFRAGGPPDLSVAVALGAPEPAPERVAAAGPLAALAGPAMAARVDLAAGRASLLARPAAAEEAVEQLLRVACALLACDRGGLLVHAAALASAGRAFLFLGPSGAGKTTVARNAAGRAVLNDDLALLWPAAGGWDVFATPFSNPTQVPPAGPASARLAALLHLVQAPELARTPLAPARAVAALAARAPIVGTDPARGIALLHRARTICAIVPSATLQLRPDPDFWQLIDPAPPGRL